MVRFIQKKLALLLNILEEESVGLLVISRNKQNPHIYLVDDYFDSHYVVTAEEVPDWDTFSLLVQRIRELYERDILGVVVEEHIPTMPKIVWGKEKDQEAIEGLVEVLQTLSKFDVDEIDIHIAQARVCSRIGLEKVDVKFPKSSFDSVENAIKEMYYTGIFDIPVYIEDEAGKWSRVTRCY